MYVVDTHALVWYLTEDRRLGSQAKDVFKNADKGQIEILIPTIVLAEAFYISKKYEVSFDRLLEKVKESRNYGTYPLNLKIIQIMKELKAQYSIHDAIIVATSKNLQVPTITKDEAIKENKDVETVWD